jgi:putative DNA primase/helicase
VLPLAVHTVIILADHDRNGAGEHAARVAAKRWVAEGRQVRIAMPPEPGTDFADILVGRNSNTIKKVTDVAA